MAGKIFSGKGFLLVTGASQGIWQKIAEVLSSTLNNGSQVLLLARNAVKLKVIHNAEYVGDVSQPTAQMIHFDIWKKYYDPNVFAEENSDINVLNYSPGHVETDMLATISNNVGDQEIASRGCIPRDEIK
uniref:Fatty acyl-CoA reductase n=1 Tax=Trichogramma kaykai TaxID=54128 RepID=A0ABD2WN43_9HYME